MEPDWLLRPFVVRASSKKRFRSGLIPTPTNRKLRMALLQYVAASLTVVPGPLMESWCGLSDQEEKVWTQHASNVRSPQAIFGYLSEASSVNIGLPFLLFVSIVLQA
jgi:hypothetical protein